tara:strand:+ start:30950 stop:31501 length:552 start_codon:yes stop_codon:yes gene_type:complete
MHTLCAHNNFFIFAFNYNIDIMKKTILVFVFISLSTIKAQELVVRELTHFYSEEKNEKSIFFSEKKRGEDISFGLKAKNRTSKDFAKCEWITSFSLDQLLYFINSLESIENNSHIEATLFSISLKKNQLVVRIKDTRCTSEHKMYYFQKSCKRSLSFVISTNQSDEIVKVLKHELKILDHVSK